jgi:hypothetical protein
MKGVNKDISALIKEAEDQGWRKKVGKRGHIKLYSPHNDVIVVLAATTRNRRAVDNAKTELRKGGMKV